MELNNREIAALFWLLVSALVILRIGWMREGMLAFFKVIFMRRMMRWSLYMCGYLSLICYGLHMIELWSLADLKATLLWLITAGFYMVYHAVNEEPLPGKLFSETFKNGFNIAVVLEFFVGIRYQEVRNWWRYSIRYRPEDYPALLRSLAESKDFTTE